MIDNKITETIYYEDALRKYLVNEMKNQQQALERAEKQAGVFRKNIVLLDALLERFEYYDKREQVIKEPEEKTE